MNSVIIGGSAIGDGHPCVIVAEGGINAAGDVNLAKKMIDVARDTGCNAIKWQKRTIEVVYSAEELGKLRESPFGSTNGDLKRGLEFGEAEYDEIHRHCSEVGISWWASAWDEASVDFLAEYDIPAFKIASASLTDDGLLKYHRRFKKPIILSTAMSTLPQIDHAVEVLGTDNLVLMQCTGTYPSKDSDLNLRVIQAFRERYKIPIGYSGHELGLATTVVAVALGANMVERHLTLNRSSFGSDQAASVEPQGIKKLVRDIRVVESAMGDGIKRIIPDEIGVMKKLRRVDSQNLSPAQ